MDARPRSPTPGRQPILTPAQVIALALVAASLGWAAWLLRDRPIREETELLPGTVLPSSELALMEAAFDRAQLTDYRTEGGRVYVPRSRQSGYMRALVDAEALPREFGGSLRRALANNSPWQSRAVQAELLRVATQDELSLVLCSMPGIERAAVLYDVEERQGLAGGTVKTASVSIRTQPDAELDASRMQAIRVLVAASIAGLSPERVAVTDLRSGRVFTGPIEAVDDDSTDPVLTRKLAYERALAAKLRRSLAYVQGVLVDVTAEFAAGDASQPVTEQTSQKPADANTPAELPGAVPEKPRLARGDALATLQVSIAIPAAYLQAIRGPDELDAAASAAADAAEIDRIRDLAARMLPATAEPAGSRVTVTSFPTPGSAARRACPPAAARETTATTPAGPPRSLQELLGLCLSGNVRFDQTAVPREILVAGGSLVAGLIAALLWLAGGRRRPGAAARRKTGSRHPRIDWSQIDGPRVTDDAAGPAESQPFRAAA